jgi:hypothetical protein
MPIVGQFGSLAGFGVFPGGAFESIATVTVGAGGVSTVTISSIPGTFQHLHLRVLAQDARSAANASQFYVTYNSDTASNYTEHQLAGDGSAASAYGAGGVSAMSIITGRGGSGFYMGANIIDILDYANTSKFKTLRSLGGADNNGSGQIRMDSGLWRSTSAITSITFTPLTANIAQHSTFALYGVRG